MSSENTPNASPTSEQIITPKNRRLSGISKTSSRKSSKFLPMSPSHLKEKEKTLLSSLFSNVLIILIWAVIILFLNNVYKVITKEQPFQKLPFCDTEDYNPIEHCISCPKNGFCTQGQLTLCDKPYFIENGICTLNRTETRELIQISRQVFEKLALKSGEHECGFIQQRFEEEGNIKELLEDKYQKFKTFIQENPQIGIEYSENGYETTRGYSKKSWKCLSFNILMSKNMIFVAFIIILYFIYKSFC